MARLDRRLLRAGLDTLYFSGMARMASPLLSGVGFILTLHRVRPAVDDPFQPNRLLEVTPAFLRDVIVGLRARGIELVSLDEAVRRLEAREFGRRFATLTFDDGYRDNLTYAWPILRRHEVPATIFVASAFAEGIGELWWVALERAIARNERMSFGLDGAERAFDCATPAAKAEAFATIYWLLRNRDRETDLRRVVRQLAATSGIDMAALCRELCMGWDEIGELAREPLITIGAHTVSHPILAKAEAETVAVEMSAGADRIVAETGKRPAHFAFPVGDNGSAGAREFAIAAALGFKSAVTTRPGVLFPEHAAHLTSLPRISLNGEFQRWRYLDVLLSGAPSAIVNGFRRVDAA